MLADEISDLVAKHFSEENLHRLFLEHIIFRSTIGTDGVSSRKFDEVAGREITVISRKVFEDTYHFTRYREKLILKGAKSLPREISIPKVRDKLVLRAMTEALVEVF